MITRSLRPVRQQCHRTVRFSRKYNGAANGPHTTYFQGPPPEPPKPQRKIFRSILLGSTCLAAGFYAHTLLYGSALDLALEAVDENGEPQDMEQLQEAMATGVQDAAARQSPPMDAERAQQILMSRAGFSVTPQAVSHFAQLPSNLPCEDTWSSGAFTFLAPEEIAKREDVARSNPQGPIPPPTDMERDWCEWAIFDGHAGVRTAQVLKEYLPSYVGEQLHSTGCFDRPYVANDARIIEVIKKSFLMVDKEICESAMQRIQKGEGDLSHIVATAAAAHSGSCALLSLYDPVKSILRVANTGDSRAVLGRWDKASKRYVAQAMSVDQTGFNAQEVERMKRAHPGEDVVDPKTGRVHGIAVARAFGDARWKWPAEITQRAHDRFWGPNPRPNGVIKTPPYLTAEPEVMETRIQGGEHPDFLIMASDGLWDNISSEDAVTCVQMWLDRNKPTHFLEQHQREQQGGGLRDRVLGKSAFPKVAPSPAPTYSSASQLVGDNDTYYDADERSLKWRVSPKHFVVEDDNAGIHLIKNVLGGNRRELFQGIMTVTPPLSRVVRDDITVHVIFFGVNTTNAFENRD